MKVLMITSGTRGDVQPYVALGRALNLAGHEAVVASATRVGDLGARHGVRLVDIHEGPGRLTDTVAADRVKDNKRAVLRVMRQASGLVRPMLDDAWEVASEGADLVMHNPRVLAGPHVAERLGVPSVIGAFAPVFLPTKAFPAPLFAGDVPPYLNRSTYRLVDAMGVPFRKAVDRWRAETLGLPRRRGRHRLLPAPLLHAFSEHLVPTPDDWPDYPVTTGFWSLPMASNWQPPQRLVEFCDSSKPTVYVGFGSMTGDDPRRTAAAVVEGVRKAGVRAVLNTGWGGLVADDLPDDVLMVDQVSHDWLFNRVDAVVHHGGAGTTAAAAASGRPQVVCPFLADQPFWGQRVYEAGVGPPPLPQCRLNSDNLAEAIGLALDGHTGPASLLGEAVRAEDGCAKAIEELERLHHAESRVRSLT